MPDTPSSLRLLPALIFRISFYRNKGHHHKTSLPLPTSDLRLCLKCVCQEIIYHVKHMHSKWLYPLRLLVVCNEKAFKIPLLSPHFLYFALFACSAFFKQIIRVFTCLLPFQSIKGISNLWRLQDKVRFNRS